MFSSSRILLLCLCLLATTASSFAGGGTYFVSPCGNDTWLGIDVNCIPNLGPKRTIQAAINVASDGDQIFIFPGVYTESIDLGGKELHLFAPGGPDVTIIDGNGADHTVLCNSGETSNTVFEGLTITGGDANLYYGGGVLIAVSSPTFIDCVFDDNQADWGGGAVSITLGSPSFTNCQFLNNATNSGGGAVKISLGSPTFTDCLFQTNDASNGGAIRVDSGSPIFNNCDIVENTASVGGGVDVVGGTPSFIDSTVDSNHASATGGGVVVQGGVLTMQGTDVFDNLSNQRAGGIYVLGATLNISNATISSNVIDPYEDFTSYGGGIQATFGATVVGVQLLIAGNTAVYGGGLSSYDSIVQLTDVTFWLNAAERGAGLAAYSNSDITLNNCNFSANQAANSAGGLRVEESTCQITDCLFQENSATFFGGAMTLISGSLTATNVQFTENSANHGGALYAVEGKSGDLILQQSNFLNNSAVYGGALEMISAFATISDCDFTGNSAYAGGAIHASSIFDNVELNVRETVFLSNEATYSGAAIKVMNPLILLKASGSQFRNNDVAAGGTGGAVFIDEADYEIVNCDFSVNTSPNGAGIYAVAGSQGKVVNSLFRQNFAHQYGGGIYYGEDSVGEIINCTLTANEGQSSGSAVFSFLNNDVMISNSIIWGNGPGEVDGNTYPQSRYSIVPAFIAGPGCISVDPLFEDPGFGDYSLSAGSPAIDAGLNWLLPIDATDVDSDGNRNEIIDVDFMLQPRVTIGVKGKGSCNLPMVDMGAFERVGEVVLPVVMADLNGDGIVSTADLLLLLSSWGEIGDCPLADLNGDGVVGTADLLLLLVNWG